MRQNVAEVLGDNPWLWALPVFTSRGDGISFPRNDSSSSVEVLVAGIDDESNSGSDNDD